MGELPIVFENYRLLGIKVARKALRRAIAAGLAAEYDDFYQEACEVFCRARDGYDPDQNVKFSTYYYKALINQFNRRIDRECQIRTDSIDAGVAEDDPSANTMHEYLASPQETPEQTMMRKERRRDVLAGLSAQTRRLIGLLENPPQSVLEEVAALKAKADVTRDHLGYKPPTRDDVTVGFIARLIGLTKEDRARVRVELDAIVPGLGRQL